MSEKRVKELEEALRPFVRDLGNSFDGLKDSCGVSIVVEPHIVWLENYLTVADLRRACVVMGIKRP
jgi:hypothetical protein